MEDVSFLASTLFHSVERLYNASVGPSVRPSDLPTPKLLLLESKAIPHSKGLGETRLHFQYQPGEVKGQV